MRIETIVCGPLDVNTYVVWTEGEENCFVVDPGDADAILSRLEALHLRCTDILITHGHFDHIWGASALAKATGASIAVHEADAKKLESNRCSLAAMVGRSLPKIAPTKRLRDNDLLHICDLSIRVLHTPGHSQGGVCFLAENERVIFCGDTVFEDSVGRTDFLDSDQKALYHSISDRLFKLEGDYDLYPGHGSTTTLSHERTHNPFVQLGRGLQW